MNTNIIPIQFSDPQTGQDFAKIVYVNATIFVGTNFFGFDGTAWRQLNN